MTRPANILQAARRGPAPVRTAALVLIGAPLLEIVGMAHHPSVSVDSATQVAASLRYWAGLSALVHGALIALLLAILVALSEFSCVRGLRRATVRSALLLYGVGTLLMVCAALISGFVTPRVTDVALEVALPDPAMVVRLAAMAMLFNQAFARCAAILMSVGITLWSLDLLRSRAALLGAYGLLCGAGCTLAIATGQLRLNVHGMLTVTVLQALWTLGVGAWLLRAAPATLSAGSP